MLVKCHLERVPIVPNVIVEAVKVLTGLEVNQIPRLWVEPIKPRLHLHVVPQSANRPLGNPLRQQALRKRMSVNGFAHLLKGGKIFRADYRLRLRLRPFLIRLREPSVWFARLWVDRSIANKELLIKAFLAFKHKNMHRPPNLERGRVLVLDNAIAPLLVFKRVAAVHAQAVACHILVELCRHVVVIRRDFQ